MPKLDVAGSTFSRSGPQSLDANLSLSELFCLPVSQKSWVAQCL
jgi:hypothetical protein